MNYGVSPKMYGRTRKGFVYFARQPKGYYIKIGFATDLSKRGLETWYCEVLVAIGPVKQAAEARLHKRFGHLRVHREWFEPADELLDYIEELRDVAA